MKHNAHLHIILYALFVFSIGCTDKGKEQSNQANNDNLINAVLYHQISAEYRALCYQAFNLGRVMLDNDLADTNIAKPRAIIVDIDETLLDNNPYEARCIIDQITYPELWKEWVELAKAKPIPGAVDFLNYVNDRGVAIMYVTNRKEKFRDATLKNLENAGFPQVEESHLFMRTDKISKEERRLKILQNYHISLLAGDNIRDFTNIFDGKSISERLLLADSLKLEFGRRFLVLPNPIYGSWESALFENYENPSEREKSKIRLEHLESF